MLDLVVYLKHVMLHCSARPLADRLLGPHVDQPAKRGGTGIGIEQFRPPRHPWLDRMLIQPVPQITTKEPAE